MRFWFFNAALCCSFQLIFFLSWFCIKSFSHEGFNSFLPGYKFILVVILLQELTDFFPQITVFLLRYGFCRLIAMSPSNRSRPLILGLILLRQFFWTDFVALLSALWNQAVCKFDLLMSINRNSKLKAEFQGTYLDRKRSDN